jgi:histidine triad (HIT) family protein
MSDACIFCQIIEKTIPADVIYEDEAVLVFPDIRPVAPTHVLVIPKKHITSLREAEADDATVLGQVFLGAQRVAAQLGLAEDGYRCVVNVGDNGGQTVYHLHLHVLGGRQCHWPPG